MSTAKNPKNPTEGPHNDITKGPMKSYSKKYGPKKAPVKMSKVVPVMTKEEKSARKKASNRAAKCVYLLEIIIGNMKEIEDDGGKGKFQDLDEIYEQLEELNHRIIDL